MKMNYRKLQTKKLSRKETKQLFILFLAKLGFQSLSVNDKISKARTIVTAMTGNAYFTTPTPALTTVTDATDALDAAQQALDGSKIKTDLRNTAETTLDVLMSGLQGYVDAVAMKNTEIVLSAGFDVRHPRTPAVILDAPTGITAVNTQIEGQVKLKWDSCKGASLYMVQMAVDNPMPNPGPDWQLVQQSHKANVLIENLQPGTKYIFRVAVINAAGISGWSVVASCRPN